jgi:glycosyltransferase involved in cell wall biosynthesis
MLEGMYVANEGMKMNIFMIAPIKIPPVTGQIRMFTFFKNLTQKNNVILFSYSERELTKKNLKMFSLPSNMSFIQFLLRSIFRIIKTGLRYNFDIIFSSTVKFGGLPVIIANIFSKKPVIIDYPDLFVDLALERGFYKRGSFREYIERFLERFVLNKADVITVSAVEIKNYLINRSISPKKIHLIPNGADLSLFSPNIEGDEIKQRYDLNGYKSVLFVGSLAWSGIEILIKAVPEILKEIPNTKFIIVGNGRKISFIRQLKELSQKIGVEQNIIFTGYRPHNEIPEFIAAADLALFLYPPTKGLSAVCPIKIFEYMAEKKPVLATKTAEILRILEHKKTAYLVEANKEAITAGIIDLLRNKDLARKIGEAGRKLVEKIYNWRTLTERLEILMNTLVNK